MRCAHQAPGFALAVVAALLLAACAQPAARTQPTGAQRAALVASIRAAGRADDSVVRVSPLRAPAVQALLDTAHQQAAARQFKAAAQTVDKALRLAPKAPDVLQYRAELAVRLGNYAQAEKLAQRSYRLGPKVGALCARNWQTVLEMRRIAGDAAGVKAARKALAQCAEPGPVRM